MIRSDSHCTGKVLGLPTAQSPVPDVLYWVLSCTNIFIKSNNSVFLVWLKEQVAIKRRSSEEVAVFMSIILKVLFLTIIHHDGDGFFSKVIFSRISIAISNLYYLD
jgi:hypothetical protein